MSKCAANDVPPVLSRTAAWSPIPQTTEPDGKKAEVWFIDGPSPYGGPPATGRKDDGAPGLRPHYHPHYYGAFVIDPEGDNIEAVCHSPG